MSAEHQTTQDQYQKLYQEYRWQVPTRFNIAEVCCNRWADDSARIAIHYEDELGHCATLSYAALQGQANRLSNVLRKRGVQRGDRVAIVLPQRPETAIAHIACHQIGAVAMPMSVLFGPDALEYRLQDSEAVLAIIDQATLTGMNEIRGNCPALRQVIAIACDAPDMLDWHVEMARVADSFQPIETLASDPAILIYTSGTTGAPKGALLPNEAPLYNLTYFLPSPN